jgi:hypothetical protein
MPGTHGSRLLRHGCTQPEPTANIKAPGGQPSGVGPVPSD